ncbi:MAG: tetratricopeptide repeat protein, partial [Armatimonadetes bacterium]|nr:tetratricopeptide repeat protein [Armatimonadota bacterium]
KHNLGFVYEAQKRIPQAIKWYEEAEQIYSKHLPYSHTDNATILNNLGSCYALLGDFDTAEKYLVEALAICRSILPQLPVDTATSINSLATLYKVQNRLAESQTLFVEALQIVETALNADHPVRILVMNNYNSFMKKVKLLKLTRKATSKQSEGLSGIVDDFFAG